jgi:hypothetical protein
MCTLPTPTGGERTHPDQSTRFAALSQGPLSPSLSPSEGERGHRRLFSCIPRFQAKEKPCPAHGHFLIQRQWG